MKSENQFIEKEEEKRLPTCQKLSVCLSNLFLKKKYRVQKCAYTVSHKYLARGYSKMPQHSRLIPEHMIRTGVAYSSHLPT